MSPVSELSALPKALTCTSLHVFLFVLGTMQLTTKHYTLPILTSWLLVRGEGKR